MNLGHNYLIYFNYLGRAFHASYPHKVSDSLNTVQNTLQSVFTSIATNSSNICPKVKVGVYTTAGTNALVNTATVNLNIDKRLDSPTTIQYLTNKKLSQKRVPLKVFKVEKVSDEFCPKNAVKNLDYLFRFCLASESNRLSVFDHSVVTCLDEKVCLDSLKSCLDALKIPYNLKTYENNFFGDNQKYQSQLNEVELNDIPANGDFLVRISFWCFCHFRKSSIDFYSFLIDGNSCEELGHRKKN